MGGMARRSSMALYPSDPQISQVLSEAKNQPTTNWPGFTLETADPTLS